MTSAIPESRFLRACAGLPVDRTPVWLMRQAGRYMAEYRALRARFSLLEIIRQPELSCQVTMQPMKAFDLDAAIIFADILPPLEGLGLKVEFQAGEGPAILNPVRTEEDVHALGRDDLPPSYLPTLEAIKLAKKELGPLPLIGFSGAPFTLGCYSVEGGGSKDFTVAKGLMMNRPDLWHELMAKLSRLVAGYLRGQALAGADALQLFDTWAGLLSPGDYGRFALPYARQVIDEVSQTGLPVIYFSLGTGGMLETVGTCGADVIGLDWRVDLGASRRRLAPDVAVQGNLDPVALLAEWPELKGRATEVLASAAGQPGHIFNLGHGVLQQTPADNVRRLVDFVHEQ
jgi:uroporphyrinogen decarboxylase